MAKHSHTDLLIIGAGPAGLMAAAWASQYGVTTRFIDDKPGKVETGHADGLTCRTLEILDSFGMADKVLKEASFDVEMRSWTEDSSGTMHRSQTVLSQKPGLSRFWQCTLNQGRLEAIFLDLLERAAQVSVERNTKTIELITDPGPDERSKYHPISLRVHNPTTSLSSGSSLGDIEEIHAKYVIACDGAHSWTRAQLGIYLEGQQTDGVWGVMDVIPLTDFPDIRQTCAIYSKQHGAIHLVPREGKIVRLYIHLTDFKNGQERFDRRSVTQRDLLEAARKVLAPYKLDYRTCDWWSVYQVGQRVAPKFGIMDRIFLAGDAIHTHSPKVGQGMNVSFQDTYNLTWKICSVIKGLAKPEILQTYELERRTVALDLIRIDKETSAYYAGESTRLPREDLQTFRERVYSFLSGVAVEYGPSVLTASTASYDTCRNDVLCDQSLAAGIVLGRRIPSATIVNHASARPVELASLLPSTGAWRILVFPGDLTEPSQMERISKLGGALSSAQSCLNIFKDRTRTPVSPMIELFAILAGGRKVRDNVPLLSLPDVFHPFDEELGWDYDKVFVDEKSALKDGETIGVYERYGIDLLSGCIVACRPDQHVGFIGKLEDSVSLERYFSDILVETRGEKKI